MENDWPEEEQDLANHQLISVLNSSAQIDRKVQVANDVSLNRSQDFPGGAVVKNPPANAGDTGSSPGPERPHPP